MDKKLLCKGGCFMWLLMIILLIVVVFFASPIVRYFVLHPFTCLPLAISDIYKYFKYKRYNECKEIGKVFLFTANGSQAFGSGKTLSMVRWLTWVYNRYNGLKVWDSETKSFVVQRVIIISNVELKTIPYIKFVGRDQFTMIDKLDYTIHDVVLFVIDEAGMEFNSRNYKDNLPTDFLVRLLQVRHNRVSFVLTSQRFGFVDKVLRQICGVVTTCKKVWRIVMLQDFDAYALENCGNISLLRPLSTRFYVAKDDLYNSYDTTYNVEKLQDQLAKGEILYNNEILEKIGESGKTPDVVKPQWKKRYKAR